MLGKSQEVKMNTDAKRYYFPMTACAGVTRTDCEGKSTKVQFLALLPPSRVALGSLLNLSVLQLSSVKCGRLTDQGWPCVLQLPCLLGLVAQLYPSLCNPMDRSLPDSSVHGDSPGQNTGVGYHTLLQGIFPTQGSHPDFPYCRWILSYLSHQGSFFCLPGPRTVKGHVERVN